MIEIIPFDKEKIKDFKYDGVESDISGNDIVQIAEFYSGLGKGFLGLINDDVIGCGGVYPLWGEWGGCWLFLNKDARNHAYGIFKGILEKMNELVKLYDIKILQVQCLDDSLEANKLLSHLGFVKNREIKMALYGRRI